MWGRRRRGPRPRARSEAHRTSGGRHASTDRWFRWVVPAEAEDVLARLDGARATSLRLDASAPSRGTLTDVSCRVHGAWRTRRREGAADVELTPLGSERTLVELRLTAAGAAGRAPAAALAGTLGVAAPARRVRSRAGRTTVLPLVAPRAPGRLPVSAVATLTLLLFAPAVWALTAELGPTPVDADRALAEYRRANPAPRDATRDPAAAEGETSGDAAARGPTLGEGESDQGAGGDASAPEQAATEAAPGAGGASTATRPEEAGSRASATGGAGTEPEQGDAPASGAEGSAGTPGSRQTEGTSASAGADAGGTAGRPPPGVYRYGTRGGDGLQGVPGTDREYPERSTVTVTHEGCGYVEHWRVFDERWDERETCTGGQRRGIARQTSYREFSGYGEEQDLACEEQRPEPARARQPERSWPITCSSDDTRFEGTVTVRGVTTLDVGGTEVEAVHLRLTGELSGGLEGTQELERWVAPDRGDLVIREEGRTEAAVDSPMGPVTYREQYRIDLLHLRPRT